MAQILSVGIDIGTSTTQLVFSRIEMDNTAGYFTAPRIAITGKEILYKSQVYFTPLKTQTLIDADAVREIVAQEFRNAGYSPADTQTGAVIITGESARKENSASVLQALSDFAGEFVVSTAGPDLESIIAGKGSGAWQYSIDNDCTVVNLDIGGGTSNIVFFNAGDTQGKICLDVGGRLIRLGTDQKMNQKEPSPTVQYRLLSGNDLGVLVLSYLCATRDMKGKSLVSSFVSTPLADRLAAVHGMNVIKTPVGFKFIAENMDKFQEDFGYGFEESNGMIVGLYARDKDGVVGARLICQAADYFRKKGSCAAEELDRLNAEYGPVFSKTIDVKIAPDVPKPETTVTEYDDGSKVVVRPSGTEPKIKYYFFASSPERLAALRKEFNV